MGCRKSRDKKWRCLGFTSHYITKPLSWRDTGEYISGRIRWFFRKSRPEPSVLGGASSELFDGTGRFSGGSETLLNGARMLSVLRKKVVKSTAEFSTTTGLTSECSEYGCKNICSCQIISQNHRFTGNSISNTSWSDFNTDYHHWGRGSMWFESVRAAAASTSWRHSTSHSPEWMGGISSRRRFDSVDEMAERFDFAQKPLLE
jgi:hypothetical protein